MTWDENIARYIARKEGFVPVAYGDGANMAIGFGHNDKDVKPGMKVTLAQARELLKDDLDDAAAMVNNWLKVPVTQDVFNMLVTAALNMGVMVKVVIYFLNNGQEGKAFGLLSSMIYLKGKENPGLKKRREQEVDIGRTGNYGDLTQYRSYRGAPGKDNFTSVLFPEGGFP